MTAFQAPETKSAEVAAAYDELARAFSAFKDTNETRLAEIETRLSPDPLAEEKLARIGDALDQAQRRIDRIALDARRPALAAPEPRDRRAQGGVPALFAHRRGGRPEAPRGEGALGRIRSRRRLSRARHRRARGAAPLGGDLADPRDRLGAPSQAGSTSGPSRRPVPRPAGSARPARGRRPPPPSSPGSSTRR